MTYQPPLIRPCVQCGKPAAPGALYCREHGGLPGWRRPPIRLPVDAAQKNNAAEALRSSGHMSGTGDDEPKGAA